MTSPERDTPARMVGHVDHGKTTLTAAILGQQSVPIVKPRLTSEIEFIDPSWNRWFVKTQRRAALLGLSVREYCNLPAEHHGGKAARKMNRRRGTR